MAITNPTPGQLVKDDYGSFGIILQVSEDGQEVRMSWLNPQDPSTPWPKLSELSPAE